MSELVCASTIEGIVGIKRDPWLHYARAVSDEEMLYILHSRECIDTGRDLRRCPISLALDKGIDSARWDGYEDQTVRIVVDADGRLTPTGLST